MEPFKFEPMLKPTIWGGSKIASIKGMPTNPTPIGESWELSAVPGHESIVAGQGVDAGKSLSELIGKYGQRLMGQRAYEQYDGQFPLLVKIIDARQDLSVQVHPDDTLAKQRHGCAGKTEMWYVVQADEGAKIYAGMAAPVTAHDFDLLAAGKPAGQHHTFMDLMAAHEAHPGDLFFIPAGRLHAIGAGCLLVEIQQSSDITYRVYDYDRKDANGNKRQLHIEQAREAIDYQVYSHYRSSYDSTLPVSPLISCPYFQTQRIVVDGTANVDLGYDAFIVVVCLRGNANINGTDIAQGETMLVPACDNVLHISGNACLLTATA